VEQKPIVVQDTDRSSESLLERKEHSKRTRDE